MHNLYPEIRVNGIILWDNNYNFERNNNLFSKDITLRTFIVNDTNKILHYGNPIIKKKTLNKYIHIINN